LLVVDRDSPSLVRKWCDDRAGEQHSFILRPINPTWKPVAAEDAKSTKLMNLASGTGHLRVRPTDDSSVEYEAGHYAVLVSCRCSHSGETP
jgi:hypothetical protein